MLADIKLNYYVEGLVCLYVGCPQCVGTKHQSDKMAADKRIEVAKCECTQNASSFPLHAA